MLYGQYFIDDLRNRADIVRAVQLFVHDFMVLTALRIRRKI